MTESVQIAALADDPDASALREWIRTGALTPSALVEQQLARLDAVNPVINAAAEILRESALTAASAPLTGPLAGLTCSVKETLGIAGHPVSAGSKRMCPREIGADAEVVRRLRAAGAVIIARGNVPEFAMTAETTSPRHGVTRNPLDPSRGVGGSSGGDAALVAAGAVSFGVGSDILGSIRIPAAFCGLVGFKPASDAVPKTGTWPTLNGFSDSWLAIGPLARSVRDARLVYAVLAGDDLPEPPARSRLVIAPDFPVVCDLPCIALARAAAERTLIEAGFAAETQSFPEVRARYGDLATMMLYDMEDDWYRLLGSGGRRFSLLAEWIARLSGRPTIDHGLFLWLLHGATIGRFTLPRSGRGAERLVGRFMAARDRVRAVLGADGILVLPTMGLLAPPHGEMNRRTLRPGFNPLISPLALCNYADLPAIALPAWRFTDPQTGLPPSVMLVAAPGNEAGLFAAASLVERAIGRPVTAV
jgi:Asp-tRNA(Asn)/Glu-tRNA(Gln) amidotransferase A subunit family amidase